MRCYLFLVTALSMSVTSFAQSNSKQHERINLGSIKALLPNGNLSTCSQLGLAIQDADKIGEISKKLNGVVDHNFDCSLTSVVGICETQTKPKSTALIYTEVYYYAPAYTRESAEAVCSSSGGQFGFL
jgi:hypothetical protein